MTAAKRGAPYRSAPSLTYLPKLDPIVFMIRHRHRFLGGRTRRGRRLLCARGGRPRAFGTRLWTRTRGRIGLGLGLGLDLDYKGTRGKGTRAWTQLWTRAWTRAWTRTRWTLDSGIESGDNRRDCRHRGVGAPSTEVFDLVRCMHTIENVRGVQPAKERRRTVSQHEVRHGAPLGAVLAVPSLGLCHSDGRLWPFEDFASGSVIRPCDTDRGLACALDAEPERREPAAGIESGNDEGGGPCGPPVDDVQVLHNCEWTRTDTLGHLQGDQSIPDLILASVLLWHQIAGTESQRHALSGLEVVDVRESRIGLLDGLRGVLSDFGRHK